MKGGGAHNGVIVSERMEVGGMAYWYSVREEQRESSHCPHS